MHNVRPRGRKAVNGLWLRAGVLATLGGLAPPTWPDAMQDTLAAEGAALIAPFQQELLDTVMQAMRQGGPEQAVAACQIQAPKIAAAHSAAPWRVGRTSLKLRNPANAPDRWERQVLEAFQRRAADGEPLETMTHMSVVDGEFRFMKAIGTAAPCLVCHGEALAPPLAAVIDERYPGDQARGFKAGALRGAFTLRRTYAPE